MSLWYKVNRVFGVFKPPVTVIPLPDDVSMEIDIAIPMRDGKCLYANLFRPADASLKDKPRPVIVSAHPYSKDILPVRGWIWNSLPLQYRLLRMADKVTMSEGCSWEAPDPAFWVTNGFNVVNIDVRGFYKSTDAGKSTIICDQEAEDYYDAIEWIAKQQWCNGKVGLCGVSYLAISQYKVAALNPPHLMAICPWEGLSDTYKDLKHPGGVTENGFSYLWVKELGDRCNENILELMKVETRNHPFFLSKAINFEAIKVPALICMSYSDHGLHTSGSFRLFRKISSQYKWLWTHRTGKWSSFYGQEETALQLKFFNYFLKGETSNGMLDVPRVRIEVRDRGHHVHSIHTFADPDYPTRNTQWKQLSLTGDGKLMVKNDTSDPQSAMSFRLLSDCASFKYAFDEDTIIHGPMKLSLVISSGTASDMNLYAFVRKIDSNGQEIVFEGMGGFGEDVVSKGWQRVALRKPYDSYSEPWDCDKPYDEIIPLKPITPEQVTIQLLPAATFFEKGSTLVLEIRGKFIFNCLIPIFQVLHYEPSAHDDAVEIHCGKVDGVGVQSHLLIGVLPQSK